MTLNKKNTIVRTVLSICIRITVYCLKRFIPKYIHQMVGKITVFKKTRSLYSEPNATAPSNSAVFWCKLVEQRREYEAEVLCIRCVSWCDKNWFLTIAHLASLFVDIRNSTLCPGILFCNKRIVLYHYLWKVLPMFWDIYNEWCVHSKVFSSETVHHHFWCFLNRRDTPPLRIFNQVP